MHDREQTGGGDYLVMAGQETVQMLAQNRAKGFRLDPSRPSPSSSSSAIALPDIYRGSNQTYATDAQGQGSFLPLQQQGLERGPDGQAQTNAGYQQLNQAANRLDPAIANREAVLGEDYNWQQDPEYRSQSRLAEKEATGFRSQTRGRLSGASSEAINRELSNIDAQVRNQLLDYAARRRESARTGLESLYGQASQLDTQRSSYLSNLDQRRQEQERAADAQRNQWLQWLMGTGISAATGSVGGLGLGHGQRQEADSTAGELRRRY